MTNPIITKKLDTEKLRESLANILQALPEIDPHDDEVWMVDKCLPRFIVAMTEAYDAGQASSAGEEMRRVQWRKDIEVEAQRETAREIVEFVNTLWSDDASSFAAAARCFADTVESYLTSKHLQPEDKPTNTKS